MPIPVPSAETARRWALEMTRRPSVTGTRDEASFGPWLAERLAADPSFAQAEIWTEPVGEGDRRHSVFLLARGASPETVVLTGHYDTVSIDDYGDLRALATEPDRLLEALRVRLSRKAETSAERRASEDLAGDRFLPGRGLLDMKAGLAAGLAVIEAFLAAGPMVGGLLFVAVPDEENASAGARHVGANLAEIARRRGFEPVAAINLDAIADDGDGSSGRKVALGTVGKVLPTAFIAGLPAHSGFPFNGVSASALAAAMIARVEWAPELTDHAPGQPSTPPSLLSLRDSKTAYDVTTPATIFASFNVLNLRRRPDEAFAIFEKLCAQAAAGCLETLKARARAAGRPDAACMALEAVPVHRFEAVLSAARAQGEGASRELEGLAGELAASTLSFPEQCAAYTARCWALSGLPAPAIVVGLGSVPYLPTSLSDTPGGRRLASAVEAVCARSREDFGEAIGTIPYFPGISDMSFFGEAEEAGLETVARNTPLWDAMGWPKGRAGAGIPTVNLGPWGRDYHTPLERMDVRYAFETLPAALAGIVARFFNSE